MLKTSLSVLVIALATLLLSLSTQSDAQEAATESDASSSDGAQASDQPANESSAEGFEGPEQDNLDSLQRALSKTNNIRAQLPGAPRKYIAGDYGAFENPIHEDSIVFVSGQKRVKHLYFTGLLNPIDLMRFIVFLRPQTVWLDRANMAPFQRFPDPETEIKGSRLDTIIVSGGQTAHTFFSFFALDSLERMVLDFGVGDEKQAVETHFTSEVAERISRNTRLQVLQLRGIDSADSGAWKELAEIRVGKRLGLRDIGLSADTPGFQEVLSALIKNSRTVDLDGIREFGPKHFHLLDLANLRGLRISNCPLIGDEALAPSSLQRASNADASGQPLGKLESLELAGLPLLSCQVFPTLFGDGEAKALTPQLRHLEISNCEACEYRPEFRAIRRGKLSSVTLSALPGGWDAALIYLADVTSLKQLKISGDNFMSAAGQTALARMTGLKELRISSDACVLSDHFTVALADFASLRTLAISNTSREVSTHVLDTLSGCQQLTSLGLSLNEDVSEKVVQGVLDSCPNAKSIDLGMAPLSFAQFSEVIGRNTVETLRFGALVGASKAGIDKLSMHHSPLKSLTFTAGENINFGELVRWYNSIEITTN